MEYIHEFEKPPRVTLKRSLIILIGNVLGIYIISFFGMGVEVNYFDDIFFFVIFIAIINAILRPILTRVFMPFLVFTFGVGSLVLNGILLELF